jgi:hypothetical protein
MVADRAYSPGLLPSTDRRASLSPRQCPQLDSCTALLIFTRSVPPRLRATQSATLPPRSMGGESVPSLPERLDEDRWMISSLR